MRFGLGRAYHNLNTLSLYIKSGFLVSEVVVFHFFILLALISTCDFNRLDLIFDSLDEFFLAMEIGEIRFVQQKDILAGILLELLVDQYPIDKKCSISKLLTVCSIDNVDKRMEAGYFANYLFFRNVVADKVAKTVTFPSDLNCRGIVGYRRYSLKIFSFI